MALFGQDRFLQMNVCIVLLAETVAADVKGGGGGGILGLQGSYKSFYSTAARIGIS